MPPICSGICGKLSRSLAILLQRRIRILPINQYAEFSVFITRRINRAGERAPQPEHLATYPLLKKAVDEKRVEVHGLYYDLATGALTRVT